MSLANQNEKKLSSREDELPLLAHAHNNADLAPSAKKKPRKSRRNQRKTEKSKANKPDILQSPKTTHNPTEANGHQSPDNKQSSSFDCLQSCLTCLICCAIGCWLVCPPVPCCIVKKLAFDPPRRGKYYGLSCKDEDGEMIEVDSARKAYKKEEIHIIPKKHVNLLTTALNNSYAFIVKTAKKNHLACVWLTSNRPSGKNVIFLMAHENACDLGTTSVTCRAISDSIGSDAVLFDYSGYGMSSGRASEANIYADIKAVYKEIRQRNSAAKIVLMGISLGTAACVDLASKNLENVAGVVLVAPFASGCRVFCCKPNKNRSPCLDNFRSIDKVGLIDPPVLLIHGTKDSVIPSSHSVALMKKIKNPVEPLYVKDADHNNVMRYIEANLRLIIFIYEVL